MQAQRTNYIRVTKVDSPLSTFYIPNAICLPRLIICSITSLRYVTGLALMRYASQASRYNVSQISCRLLISGWGRLPPWLRRSPHASCMHLAFSRSGSNKLQLPAFSTPPVSGMTRFPRPRQIVCMIEFAAPRSLRPQYAARRPLRRLCIVALLTHCGAEMTFPRRPTTVESVFYLIDAFFMFKDDFLSINATFVTSVILVPPLRNALQWDNA